MERSVHDNFLAGYEVNGDLQEIRLRTEFRDKGKPYEFTDVLFTGVEAYEFRYDNFGNIIFDVCEVPLDKWVADLAESFAEGHRQAGWPHFLRSSGDGGLEYLRQHSVRAFELSSSYGMRGWVLAKDMHKVNRNATPA
jgi:hypothetical protein